MPLDPRAWGMLEDKGASSLSGHVQRLMRELGLWGYHPYDSRRSASGWPDWVILSPDGGGILFRELKTARGTVSPDQRMVGSYLRRSGLDWAIWRPQDLFSGLIEDQLRALTR